ncbi:MAG TPA: hypothetical protein VFL84_02965 [Gammaproteobacteria bacterium]|nr:hypothetical protein [Gammaproteobacteria bacterium]
MISADDGVAAARQLEAHGIGASFVGVVLDQPAAQTAGLDADERVGLRIEVRRTAEHLDGDRVTLEPVALTGQRLLGDVAQERRRARGLPEAAARENAL